MRQRIFLFSRIRSWPNPDFATKIGFIVEAWTFIERGLRDILTYTLGCRMEQAYALLHSQPNVSARIALTKSVVHLMPDHPLKSDLLGLIRDIGNRTKTRNKIVHGQYIGGDDKFGYSVVLARPVSGRNQHDDSPLPNVLDNHARDLRELMDRLYPFIENQPDAPGRLPVIWRTA